MINVAVMGANGRMGRALIKALAGAEGVALGAALVRPGHPLLGQDAGLVSGIEALDVPFGDSLAAVAAKVNLVVDFTAPDHSPAIARDCACLGLPLVVGTTGLSQAQQAVLHEAAKTIALVFAPNMSVGVNLLLGLVELAAQVLGDSVDVEILEAHHRHKKDAPSGTALALGEAAAKALGRDLKDCAVYGREGITGERERQTIGFATVRGGDIIGEHTVLYAGDGERLELTHKAHHRDTFATGAVRAARWLAGRGPGFYDMKDVLGLR